MYDKNSWNNSEILKKDRNTRNNTKITWNMTKMLEIKQKYSK